MSSFIAIGISPFHRPDARLCVALCRAGALGVLDLGADGVEGLRALSAALACLDGAPRHEPRGESIGLAGRLGVRVHAGSSYEPSDLPAQVAAVLLPPEADPGAWRLGDRRILAEVVSLAEAERAASAGFDGLIATGNESGGRVGESGAYVLLQELVEAVELPVYVRGGIGPRTAAACLAGGASGVVLDDQLALVRESGAPRAVRDAVRGMDGSETVVLAGYRVYTRPDLAVLARHAQSEAIEVREALGWRDLKSELLPLGASACLAASLAERYRTAGGVVGAVLESARAGVRLARELAPLAPGSALAKAHGTRYPILQGPMTRVSDRASFAEAVERGGGLSFLALALMRGPQVAELVRETSERMGDRPWGIGILGFVPAELREEQLSAIAGVRVPYAVIAGGRPSLAKGLEERGTVAYLHVPSPGLLELFLKEGGRRFIFEGRECGGHVGPRSSFSLWESQLAVLERFERPEELSVVFAGGIHDARSAAMVAAMSAKLAARGAKVGVLMGTAYLFTEEAVSCGAIQPAFQEMALSCRETALLETAPGHATRCVETEYVRTFREKKSELEAQGLEPRAVWEELEKLNLGRLRIASKGLKREGAELVEVGSQEQVREGMYMIGQVAALRSRVTTIEALHAEVSAGSAAELAALSLDEERKDEDGRPADVAVIGMACVFPGARDLASFWSNVVRGVDAVSEIPAERWDPELYYDAEGEPGRTTPSKWGGFLDAIVFDPSRYGIPPKSLAAIEAVQLLSLEVAQRALEDAGYAGTRAFRRERTAVIFGAEAGTELAGGYGFRAMFPQFCGKLPEPLEEALPVLTEDSFPGVLANVIAGRIANRLDLGGMNFTVDAACASSLAAVEVGVAALTSGRCDMAVVGGADTHNSINDYLLFSSVHALSKQGRCRSFDAAADGITLGEGVGAVVLKRLADAERDGDRIYGVIQGIAGSSDGKSLGLTAPRKDGQVRALERAYRQAGIAPERVGLMEAHGTGTVVGDRTELDSMQTVFAKARTASCALGSVKSQIGHTKCAAGMASLIKVVLSLYRGVLPPTLHMERPNPGWDASKSPFFFLEHAQPWPAAERIGAVSAFGFGGTNFHAVVSAHEDPLAGEARLAEEKWPAELFLFRGRTRAEALLCVEALERRLSEEWPRSLAELASASASAGSGPVEIAIVASDAADLAAKLARARRGEEDLRGIFARSEKKLAELGSNLAELGGPKLAFLYPGQGSQRLDMGAELFVSFPSLGRWLVRGSKAAAAIYPPRAFDEEKRKACEEALKDTRAAQPALGLVDLATHQVLEELGIEPALAAGHSYGELAALCAAGAIAREELFDLSERRAEAILRACGEEKGAMAAVSAGAAALAPLLVDIAEVVLANHNAPEQTVISGPEASIEAALARLKEHGIGARKIAVACAFHSGMVKGAGAAFGDELARRAIEKPRFTVYSNRTGEAYPADAGSVRRLLCEQLESPVLFTREIEAMYRAGARIFVEVGPGRVLTGLVEKILGSRPHAAIATDGSGRGLVDLLLALARLSVLGVEPSLEGLYRSRGILGFDLEKAPERRLPALAWYVNGHRAWPAKGELPAEGMVPMTRPPVELATMSTNGHEGQGREASVVEYLRNLRELAEAQRQVMLSWLGTAPGALEAPARPAREVPAREVVVREAAAPRSASVAAHAGNGAPSKVTGNGAEGAAVAAHAPATRESMQEVLLSIVSERTGYPTEMLGLDLDLEGDLSIDSIKRIEILGALNEKIGGVAGAGGDMESVVEELASIKTLRGILDWLESRRKGAAPSPASAVEPSAQANGAPASSSAQANGAHESGAGAAEDVAPERAAPERSTNGKPPSVLRYVLRVVEAPAVTNGRSLKGAVVALSADTLGVSRSLALRLESAGARVHSVCAEDELAGTDYLVHLSPLSPGAGPETVKELFELSQKALRSGVRGIVGVTGMGGVFGHAPIPRMGPATGARAERSGGVAGLLKSLAKEHPELFVRAIDVDPSEDAARLAEAMYQELGASEGPIEVGWREGRRYVLRVEARELEANGAGSFLTKDSVVLLTGGARGITAQIAVGLARRHGCRLELVGRSPLPSAAAEEPELAAAKDALALKRLLAQKGTLKTPAEIEERARKIQAEREIARTLGAIEAAGGSVRYHSLDVRESEAFGRLIEDLYAEHGRIDGVIHGAGVIEDKLLVDKTRGSFDRVFDTKVRGALVLAEKLRSDVGFVVFFSSVSSAFGNRGQTDYAAANDLLDKLAHRLSERLEGRVVSINWGPWDSTGMVSPELRREYERRGIGLIPLEHGSERLFDELHARGDCQVILMSAAPEAMA